MYNERKAIGRSCAEKNRFTKIKQIVLNTLLRPRSPVYFLHNGTKPEKVVTFI